MAEKRATALRWVREHPLMFGIYVGFALGLLLLLGMFVDLPLVKWLMDGHAGWIRLAAYTITLFAVLAKNYYPRSHSFRFWTLFAGLLLLHLVCSIWFILKIKPLGSIHYIVYGPFEYLLIALLLDRGVQYFGVTAEQ